MKLLVFSDIHGSLPVVESIADRVRRFSPDAVVLLGDILYHGPRNPLPQGYNPKAVVEALSPLADRIVCIQGNCDSEVDSMVLPFPLAPHFSWLLHEANGKVLRIFATHGHIYGPDAHPCLKKGDILLFGHTHIPLAERNSEGICLCNPGSLALPKDGTPPSYGLFDQGVFSIYTAADELYKQLDCN